MPHSRLGRAGSVIVAGLCMLALAACHGGAGGSRRPATGASSTLGPTKPGIDAGDPVVMGGAQTVPSPGSPALCTALAGSVAIRSLPTSITKLADPATAAAGAKGVADGAHDLRVLAVDADPGTASTMRDSADALDQLAVKGIADAAALDASNRSLTRLGERMQGLCHFPGG